MSIGPERAKLRQYLQGARHDATSDAGLNWFSSGEFLDTVSQAMIAGAKTAAGDKTSGKKTRVDLGDPWADKDLPRSTHPGRPAHPIRSSVVAPAYPAASPEPGTVPLPSHLVA